MKPIQQDDIQDWLNEPKKAFRWLHVPTGKIVRAINKKKAVSGLKRSYNITADKSDVRQALMTE